jgi:hypothetical protein
MARYVHHVVVDRGALFQRTLKWYNPDGSELDLAGYTIIAHLKRDKILTDTPIATFTVVKSGNAATISLSPTTTKPLSGLYFYDVIMYPGGDKTLATRELEGNFQMSEGVTDAT